MNTDRRRIALTTELALARIGALLAPTGAAVLIAGTILHPSSADPNDLPAALAEYAADIYWVGSHLAQFAGFVLLMLALAAFAATLEPGRASAWLVWARWAPPPASLWRPGSKPSTAWPLKAAADRWVAATGESRSLAYESAFAVRQNRDRTRESSQPDLGRSARSVRARSAW